MAYSRKQKNEFIDLLVKRFNGNISKACQKFGISRAMYYNWMEGDSVFAERVKEAEEAEKDEAEEFHRMLRKGIPKVDKNNKLVGWIVKPDRQAIEYYLSRKAKDRGYIERQEVTGKDGEALSFTLNIDGKKPEVKGP